MYTEHAEELCCASAIRTALLRMMRTTKIARKIACTLRGIYAAAHHHARLLVCQLGESTGRAAVSSSAGPWTWLWMTCWTSPLLTPPNAAIPRCASNCFGISLLQCARMIVRARTAGVIWRMHAPARCLPSAGFTIMVINRTSCTRLLHVSSNCECKEQCTIFIDGQTAFRLALVESEG